MDTKSILDSSIWRSAIKKFDETKKIKEEDFNILLEVARFSPTSFGLEPWKILVIQDENLRGQIADFSTGARTQLQTSSHFVIITVTTDLKADSKYFKYMMTDVKGFEQKKYDDYVRRIKEFQEVKHCLVDDRKRIDWAGKQAYIVLGNMMLAAATMEIDSCPIEGFIPKKIDEVLHRNGVINKNNETIAVMVAFGFRTKETEPLKSRRPINNIVKYI